MPSNSNDPPAEEQTIHSTGRSEPPDVRFIHYNDVYHIEAGSAEPVGGIARFKSMCNYYRSDNAFAGQPDMLTFFSGDAYNPSLESSVTKGSHMVPVLNQLGTDVACVGNHDLDFGVTQFRHLASKCNFPWLLGNVIDPALGDDVPLGNAKKTVMLTTSNGIKIGVLGLVEREWLDTINSLPPDLEYRSATAVAKVLVPQLREQGADMIIAVTHAREPNDDKLARQIPSGLIDIILGGHDHFYGHKIINQTHVLRSGTDFKQLSYLKAWRKADGSKGWDFDVVRRDIVRSIPEDPEAAALVEKITAGLRSKLEKPIGYTAAPLDARFTTVRLKESNLANFVCDLMRSYYQADCTIMAAGTVRGDQVYQPGLLKLKDIMACFPFEDPVVVIKSTGKAIWDALENGVSQYPALEGRFPQVSNIHFTFDPDQQPGSRIKSAKIAGHPINFEKKYVLATRDYMTRGKDGYNSLLCTSAGGENEEIVSDENGMILSMILRQYFQSIKAVGKWKRWGPHMHKHWAGVQEDVHSKHPVKEPEPQKEQATETEGQSIESDSEDEHIDGAPIKLNGIRDTERRLIIMRKVLRKWFRLAGLKGHPTVGEAEGEFTAGWTKSIAPRIEGRIRLA